MKYKYQFSNIEIPIQVEKSKRKSMVISVRDMKQILVKVPKNTSVTLVYSFILAHKNWIEKRLKTIKSNSLNYKYEVNSKVPFLGDEYTIKTIGYKSSGENSIVLKGDNIKLELEKFYRDNARKIITERVNYFCNKLNINYQKIFIKSQKTRWGSCSSKRNLNFNYKIVIFNRSIIDYLVIHEVSHLIEMNHSYRFWDIVKSLDPNFRDHKDFLTKNGFVLFNFLE